MSSDKIKLFSFDSDEDKDDIVITHVLNGNWEELCKSRMLSYYKKAVEIPNSLNDIGSYISSFRVFIVLSEKGLYYVVGSKL